MIKSKHIIEISEKYSSSGQAMGHRVEVFEDPTSSDILSLSKNAKDEGRKLESVRFIADATSKKVYVADAYNVTHDHIRQFEGYPSRFSNTGNSTYHLIEGLATVQNGKLFIKNCDRYKESFQYNWTFADSYINGFSTKVNSYKQYFK